MITHPSKDVLPPHPFMFQMSSTIKVVCTMARRFLILALCTIGCSTHAEEQLTMLLPGEKCPEYKAIVNSYTSHILTGMFGGHCEDVKTILVPLAEKMLYYAEQPSCYGPQWDHAKAIAFFKDLVKTANNQYNSCLEKKNFLDGLEQENAKADKAERDRQIKSSPTDCVAWPLSQKVSAEDSAAAEKEKKLLETCTRGYDDEADKLQACSDVISAIRACGPGARRVSDHFYEAVRYRALVYVDKKDHALAMADLNEMIAHYPDDQYYYALRSSEYEATHDLDHAISDQGSVIRLQPLGSNFTKRARMYLAKGDFDRAMADYAEAIRIGEKYAPDYLAERGDVYRSKGQMDRAIADYDEAIRRDSPHEPNAYDGRGLAKKAKGDVLAGEADIIKAREMRETMDACSTLSAAASSGFNDPKVSSMVKRCNADADPQKSICQEYRGWAQETAKLMKFEVPAGWTCR